MRYKDPEKQREADSRWREANLEKARAREAAYRAANRESTRPYIAAHCASQKDATPLHARGVRLLCPVRHGPSTRGAFLGRGAD